MQINLSLNKYIFVPKFLPYISDYSHRYEVYWGGRGSGKTKFLIQKLILKGLKEKRFIVLMRKETNKVKDSVWRELLNVLNEWKLTPYFELNKSEFRAICKINSTEFRCMGLDDPEKIKGFADASDFLLDEITGFNIDDFELIDGTLRSPKYELPLQLFCSFNPISKTNFVYKLFGFDTGIVPDNTLINHSTYLDNPFLKEEYYSRMETLKERNPARYKIEALGEFATLDKLVYPYFTEGEPPEDCNKMQLLLGLDFGFTNDPTAFICSYLDEKNKKIYIFDEYYKTGMLNSDIAQMIKYKGFSKSTIIADSAEPKSIEEIRRLGITKIQPAVKGKDSVLSGIQKIQQYELVVSDNCPNTKTELQNYSWIKDKSTSEYLNKPLDMFNHLLDALRYSIQTQKKHVQTLSKISLGI